MTISAHAPLPGQPAPPSAVTASSLKYLMVCRTSLVTGKPYLTCPEALSPFPVRQAPDLIREPDAPGSISCAPLVLTRFCFLGQSYSIVRPGAESRIWIHVLIRFHQHRPLRLQTADQHRLPGPECRICGRQRTSMHGTCPLMMEAVLGGGWKTARIAERRIGHGPVLEHTDGNKLNPGFQKAWKPPLRAKDREQRTDASSGGRTERLFLSTKETAAGVQGPHRSDTPRSGLSSVIKKYLEGKLAFFRSGWELHNPISKNNDFIKFLPMKVLRFTVLKHWTGAF